MDNQWLLYLLAIAVILQVLMLLVLGFLAYRAVKLLGFIQQQVGVTLRKVEEEVAAAGQEVRRLAQGGRQFFLTGTQIVDRVALAFSLGRLVRGGGSRRLWQMAGLVAGALPGIIKARPWAGWLERRQARKEDAGETEATGSDRQG
ncbi:MAG: hypothetical protein QJR00_01375 [Bacillota bacterium]|nr:hypothetical protein [Bacillota bacterium]